MVSLTLASVGCGPPPSDEPSGDSRPSGDMTYEDANTDTNGDPQDPSSPPAQNVEIEVRMSGDGTLSGLDPTCPDLGATQFEGFTSAVGQVDSSGAYIAGFTLVNAMFETPTSGCEIPDLTIGLMSDIEVRALLQTTTQNCETYCAAKARSHGEAECGVGPGQAQCRAQAEAEYSATCTTACSGSTTRRIVASASVGVATLTSINSRDLNSEGMGEFELDLTFDRIEESDGSVVSEE